MAFVDQEDVFNAIEPILYSVFKKFSKFDVSEIPFKKITYKDAMEQYGTDKPDLRNPITICNLSKEFVEDDVEFSAFKKIINEGGEVLGIPAPNTHNQPRSFYDNLNSWAKKDLNAAGFVVDNPNKPVFNAMERDVQELLNQQINPQIKSHGGQVDVVRYDEDDSVLFIEMSGGCQGCSSSSATLKNGVETMIYDAFPDVGDIRDVTDHDSGENPYYT